MAITTIHAIYQDVAASLAYIMADKTESYFDGNVHPNVSHNGRVGCGPVTYHTLTSTQLCAYMDPLKDFERVAKLYGGRELEIGNKQSKTGKTVVAWHLTQSFEGQIDPIIANEIGRKLAEKIFPDHSTVISTHSNTPNTHNHIIGSAWGIIGGKVHNNHELYRKIRKESDALCREYGLQVLEATTNMHLSQWTDSKGRKHYYEPTQRKAELIEARKEGYVSKDNVSSYRNSDRYEHWYMDREVDFNAIRSAIENALPLAKSFEELLELLDAEGINSNGRKKDGEWRKSISYYGSESRKMIRDISLGPGYSRLELTHRIERQNAEREEHQLLQDKLRLPVYDGEYRYGRINVQNINEEYRARYAPDKSIRIDQRADAEKQLIKHAKALDADLSSRYDSHMLYQLIEDQRRARKRSEAAKTRDEQLVRFIQDMFKALKYSEEYEICTVSEALENVIKLEIEISAAEREMDEAQHMIAKLGDSDDRSAYQERLDELREDTVYARRALEAYKHCAMTFERLDAERNRVLKVAEEKPKLRSRGYER